MISKDRNKLIAEIDRIISLEQYAKLEMFKNTRTSRQNRALHLFFSNISKDLNDNGICFNYVGVITGQIIETPWTKELFKEMIWRPIQKTVLGKESTTKLKTNEIDIIFEIINKHFGENGIEVSFPCEFSYYLKQIS